MHRTRRSAPLLLAAFLYLSIETCLASPTEHGQITGPFTDAQAVTLQCLHCHAQQGADILQSSHWTWQRPHRINAGIQNFAKKNDLSTFAIDVTSNPGRCMTCHISTNLLSGRHNPNSAADIDCLVCHDTTGTYRRTLGAPENDIDLVRIAQNVGVPTPDNCLTCHGKDCGLTGLNNQGGFADDIHLKKNGAALRCQKCHPSEGKHRLSRQIAVPNGKGQPAGCNSCHGASPHSWKQLDQHAKTIGCQTCHIPAYARSTPAVISWNWLPQLPPSSSRQAHPSIPFLLKNGMILASRVQPIYLWDNGSDQMYMRGDRIEPETATTLIGPTTRDDASLIKPFAVCYATQLYDTKYRYLISPALTSAPESLFIPADWHQIAGEGMNGLRLPYSGSYTFTTTVTLRRLNHGIAPASEALDCMDCHGQENRLSGLGLGHDKTQEREAVQAPVKRP